MDFSQTPKIETPEIESLADSIKEGNENDANKGDLLVFGKSTKIKTRLHHEGNDLIAPFTGTPCAYYEIEAAYEGSDDEVFIGALDSDDVFYALIKDKLVEVDVPYFDAKPTFKKTFKTGQLSDELKKSLENLGWLKDILQNPSVTLTENVLTMNHEYHLVVEKFSALLPPQNPGENPVESITYRFHFE